MDHECEDSQPSPERLELWTLGDLAIAIESFRDYVPKRSMEQTERATPVMETNEELIERLAEQVWVIGAADQMITNSDARRSWASHKAMRSQEYLLRTHDAAMSLIALEKLGYSLA